MIYVDGKKTEPGEAKEKDVCCQGRPSRQDYDAALVRLSAAHPEWSEVRRRSRAYVESFFRGAV